MAKGIREDIDNIVGGEATDRLIGWRGGRSLYIPRAPIPGHELVAVLGDGDTDLGLDLMARLTAAYGNDILTIPSGAARDHWRSLRLTRDLIAAGYSVRVIAAHVGVSERQIMNRRVSLEQLGLIPTILRAPPTPEQLALALEPFRT